MVSSFTILTFRTYIVVSCKAFRKKSLGKRLPRGGSHVFPCARQVLWECSPQVSRNEFTIDRETKTDMIPLQWCCTIGTEVQYTNLTLKNPKPNLQIKTVQK